MADWFTIDKIDEKTYIISEYRHPEETHCYLLIGSERCLLIDTGLGVCNIYDEVRKLTDKSITAIATHIHWDHIGGHKYFPDFYVHRAELDWINGKFPLPIQAVRNMVIDRCDLPADFDINKYAIFQGIPTKILDGDEIIDLGDRKIQVLYTPGHSPGHCCFYEPKKKYLYSGDLIYKGCLDIYYPSTDIFDFWQSIKKIQTLDIKLILPAHHSLEIPIDIIERIAKGFEALQAQGKLSQGNGIFDFGDFQIHL